MHTRREFLTRAGQMSAAAGLLGFARESIQRASAIEPEPGSTVLDAEHVVILMQENRSFDHTFGALRGVRGYDDPRAITLPDGNPVWVQADNQGDHYAPFRLDMKGTNATWTGALPHGWADQTDARNQGRYDHWLRVKRSGHKDYAGMPLTLGYYDRRDIPFYYALADAFTVCDQHFCSSLTGTTPNRCYSWTGTIRARPSVDAMAVVRNEDCDHDRMQSWPTFPERLEALGISWKVYQNELSIDSGLSGAEDAWLANFTDNPLEFFTQYNVRLAANHREYVAKRVQEIPGEIDTLKAKKAATPAQAADIDKQIAKLAAALKRFEAERTEFTQEKWDKLSPREKALHARAFATNSGDPAYRQLAEFTYRDGGTNRTVRVPKGDVLYQFRKDANEGKLPRVSWIVAPQEFSDHPSSAWYGAWYVAEVMNVLTHNPDVWKKTVFLLTYDENDGYFDHVPPFVAPHPRRPEAGRVSKGIDTSVEYVELEQDRKHHPRGAVRDGPIGLGYRVPLVIASPWSRGGCVCSQVFDHTSVLQFLEKFLSHKSGKKVEEPNISRWRRAVCGDLMASFQTTPQDKGGDLTFPSRDAVVETIHKARFKQPPAGFHKFTATEIEQARRDPRSSPHLPRQESGRRRSAALPYQLAVDGGLNAERTHFALHFAAGKDAFGSRSAGSPFTVYAFTKAGVAVRNYAVEPGERVEDSWALSDFSDGCYHLRVYGPNGFFRKFQGDSDDPSVEVAFDYARATADGTPTGGLVLTATNHDGKRDLTVRVHDNAYKAADQSLDVSANGRVTLTVDTKASFGWYDLTVSIAGHTHFAKCYAGRVETGQWGYSDPQIGRASE
ncbi:phosphocholine-specific phospholipase C [Limnoglobus roseus]|uniref:phospholipase C n=1 Tax=Limnoglobus roseus TaxID=2598579 RepID=A0A5C1A6W7_9BACT|nr:phospholipase C, phosphocholine-specific [Limnoglobus roseus]QEL14999.1 phospholipase C, phosphocholine-specific [Limnoglobus roseus]